MKRSESPPPSISLGVRVAVFASLAVLGSVLFTALVLEMRGRSEVRAAAVDCLQRARGVASDRLAREGESLERLATTVARDPKFFALIALDPARRSVTFRQALEGVVRDFQRDADTEILDVTDAAGKTLAASPRAAAPEEDRSGSALVRRALDGKPARGYRVEGGRLYRVAVVPVTVQEGTVVGTVTLGSPVDERFTAAVRSATGVEVVLVPDSSARSEADPAAGAANPVVSTLTDAGTRSLLATIGARPRGARGSGTGNGAGSPRDAKEVSIAKSAALAVDVPLTGSVEGGSPRVVVAAPLGTGAGAEVGAARETLLGAGAVAALFALAFGWIVGRRVGRRLRLLAAAARDAKIGVFDTPLPSADADESGLLVHDFEAMREAQRQEIDRLVEVERMKSDYLAVTAQAIVEPAREIASEAISVAKGHRGALAPEGMARLRLIHAQAKTLAQIAEDLGTSSVVSRYAGAPASAAGEDAPDEPRAEASVEVVAADEEFVPTARVAEPDPEVAEAPAEAADPHPVEPPPAAITVPGAAASPAASPAALPVDVAALLEGIAVEILPTAAERAVEVDLAVEPALIESGVDAVRLERDVRSYAESVMATAPPGTTLSFSARRIPDAVEVRVDGGEEPLEIHLAAPGSR